jgi:hypothetical protein
MAPTQYIPAGRTSRIVRGLTELQIQTEYAARPTPRLTTTVFSSGQVIHKIEQELGLPISSPEDMLKVEGLIRKQHSEIVAIADTDNFSKYISKHISPTVPAPPAAIAERLQAIQGVEKVFRIDASGEFESSSISKDFKRKFSAVFKNLRELLDIFQSLPGGRREEGVYAVEVGRLYLLSTGREFFFVLTDNSRDPAVFEKNLHAILGR